MPGVLHPRRWTASFPPARAARRLVRRVGRVPGPRPRPTAGAALPGDPAGGRRHPSRSHGRTHLPRGPFVRRTPPHGHQPKRPGGSRGNPPLPPRSDPGPGGRLRPVHGGRHECQPHPARAHAPPQSRTGPAREPGGGLRHPRPSVSTLCPNSLRPSRRRPPSAGLPPLAPRARLSDTAGCRPGRLRVRTRGTLRPGLARPPGRAFPPRLVPLRRCSAFLARGGSPLPSFAPDSGSPCPP